MKNMKIEINEQQPLDEVVKELERLGYNIHCFEHCINTQWIFTWEDGDYTNYVIPEVNDSNHILTTLAELKGM